MELPPEAREALHEIISRCPHCHERVIPLELLKKPENTALECAAILADHLRARHDPEALDRFLDLGERLGMLSKPPA